jgi:hypothetical protein
MLRAAISWRIGILARPLRYAALIRYGAAAAFLAAGVLLIVGSQFAARAAGLGPSSIQTAQAAPPADDFCDDDDDDPVGCFGPAGQAAGILAADGTVAPDPRDADLGGVAATGVLLLTIGSAVVASSAGGLAGLAGGAAGAAGGAGSGATGAASGASGASGTAGAGDGAAGGAGSASAATGAGPGAAGAAHGAAGGTSMMTQFHPTAGGAAGAAVNAGVLGVVPAVGGMNLPVPRVELVQGGLSIFRSMKRVTDQADPRGYSPGDVAQLFGDAAGIAALASVLAPGIGLISLATGGAAVATDVKSPEKILEQMRRNFGRLGYMQGVLDENVSHADHDLGDLDPDAPDPAAAPPQDPTTLSPRDLKAARALWAIRVDTAFDALSSAQQELDDLDDRRSNLAHQIDAIGDLLDRADDPAKVGLPQYLADTIAYGRGWYFAGASTKMAAALRQSFDQARAAGAPIPRRMTSRTQGGPPDETAMPSAMTLAEWAWSHNASDGRRAILEALAGLERWRGFYDALAGSVQVRIVMLRTAADVAVAARRDLAAEVQRRALQGPTR